MKFKIAVVQFKINQRAPEENVKHAEDFIKEASGKADIIIFPEDFLSTDAEEEGKYRKIFQEFAKTYNINIVAGSIMEKTKAGNFNVCYYIESSGEIRGKYKKVNLWLTEREQISPGNEIVVFNTKFGKIGLAICWDLMFPEIFRKMARKGVNIVFCPSLWYRGKEFFVYRNYSPDTEINNVNTLCKARAIENEIILVYANAVGEFVTSSGSRDEAIGQSQITVPINGVLQKLDDKESMFIQEVDTSIIKDAEKAYQIRKDLKNKILH